MIKEFENLYQVDKRDIAECGRVLTDAFSKDAKWVKLFEGLSEKQKNAFYQEPVSYCIRYGDVYAPSDNLEGVMAVVPGKYSAMTPLRVMKTCTFSILMQGGIKLLKFLVSLDDTLGPLEKRREEIMEGREYLYIFIIGVKQDKQRQGNGKKMLTALCEYADRVQLPIYLETDTEDNKNMYEKYGFDMLEEIMQEELNMPQWTMIREV